MILILFILGLIVSIILLVGLGMFITDRGIQEFVIGLIKGGVEDMKINWIAIFGGVVIVILFGCAILFGWPVYAVWQQNKVGEAELARAEQNRQIAIQEAKAKEESAKSLANAEVIRAEGVAKANQIIGDSLKNNDAYIHYLWIEALRESKSDVIYIPTEAGIPITESSRFHITRQQADAAAKK